MRENKDYLITEKPSRALLIFSIPMIIGNLFQQAYTIVDSAIVGRYVGETALAAVGASYALYLFVLPLEVVLVHLLLSAITLVDIIMDV